MALFEPVFTALNDAGVRYVVVGGVAVVLHGHARLTADLDIAIDLSPEATAEAMEALGAIGLRPRLPVDAAELADPAVHARWIDEQGMRVLSLWDPGDPLRSVNLFVENPIEFEELWERSDPVDLGGVRTRIASIEHLIRLKRLADRPQDRSDIEALEAISSAREDEP